METKQSQKDFLTALRLRAEEIAFKNKETIENEYSVLPREQVIPLIHELHVHQLELQMQNDELRKTQEELELSRAKYFDLYDRAPVAYCTLDKNGRFLEANLAASELLDLPPTALIQQPFERFVMREFQDTWYLLRKRLQAAETARMAGVERHEIVELQMVGQTGKNVWVRLNAKVSAETDTRILIRIILYDISMVKQAETENALSEKLNHENQKLEALGALAAGVAHDFNNLLMGLYGNIELAQTGLSNGTAAEYLSDAMISLETARDLTRQLLTFAKGGGPNLKPDRLFPFIRESAEHLLKNSKVICDFDFPDDNSLIYFDATQIRQVLQHLIQNAVEAMPRGGNLRLVAKTISLAEHERANLPAGKYALFSLSDSGPGVASPLLQRIFEPFFTLKDQHHGLGLTICHSILKRHGGAIEAESSAGKGTTFHFLLSVNR